LLTAVVHELGHIVGYDHDDEIAGDLMKATLRAGDSGTAAVDVLFADW
jgi:ssRNA-specific RNase YbeY (16S rRNA maturation enzyme)